MFSNTTKRYRLVGQLRGHTDSIHAVAMAESGKLLASGGEWAAEPSTLSRADEDPGSDSVRLWDTNALSECASPVQDITQRGHPSCLVWASIPGELEQVLCYGTILGYLVVWMRSSGRTVSPIL